MALSQRADGGLAKYKPLIPPAHPFALEKGDITKNTGQRTSEHKFTSDRGARAGGLDVCASCARNIKNIPK